MNDTLKGILKKTGRVFRKTIFVILWIFFGLVSLIAVLVLVIRTPWAQNKIVEKVTQFVSGKTKTVVRIDRLFITFSGNVQIEGLYAEDLQKDTLVYSRSLEAGVAFLPLLDSKIVLKKVEWNGVTAHIKRTLPDSTFNFNFFIDAFASKEPKTPEPKTDSKPLKFDLGVIHLSDIRGTYNDEVIKLDTRLVLGDLYLDTRDFDLQKMNFDVRKLTLKNTTAYVRKDPVVSAPDTTTSTMPQFHVGDLQLDNVHALYESPYDSLSTEGHIAHFTLTKGSLDLDKQSISLGNTLLANSTVKLHLPKGSDVPIQSQKEIAQQGFQWPGWTVTSTDLQLQNDYFSMHIGDKKTKTGEFDPNHIELNPLNLHASNAYFKKEAVGLTLTGLTFKDRSGFTLDKLGFELAVDKKNISLKKLDVQTSNSSLQGAVSMTFADLLKFIDDPKKAYVDLTVSRSSLSLKDAYFFAPQLRDDTTLQKIGVYPVKFITHTKGYFDDLDIRSFNATWAQGTQLHLAGKIKGLPNADSLYFDIPDVNLTSVKHDWLIFIKEDSSFQMPANALIKANAIGSIKDLHADASLTIPEGNVNIEANYKKLKLPVFDGHITINELNVARILPTSKTGLVSMKMDFDGKGDNLQNLEASFYSTFSKLQFYGYNYKGLVLNGRLQDQLADIYVQQKDTNLNMLVQAHIDLDTLNPYYKLDLNLEGANFYNLGLTTDNLKGRMKLSADFAGNPENFKAHLTVNDGLVIKGTDNYAIGNIIASAEADSAHTQINLQSDVLKADAQANTDPEKLLKAMRHHVANYFKTKSEKAQDTFSITGVSADAHILVNNTRLLTEVIAPQLQQMDSIGIKMMFRQDQKRLNLQVAAPKIVYGESALGNLIANLATNPDTLGFNLSFDSLAAGPARIYKTNLAGHFNNDSLQAEFAIQDRAQDTLLHLAGNAAIKGDSSLFHIDKGNLIFNKEHWEVPENNLIVLADKSLLFRDFKLENQNQLIALTSYPQEKDRFKLHFDQFRLATITSLINAEQVPANGILKGDVDFQHIFTKLGFEAGLTVDSMSVLSHSLGRAKLQSNNLNNDTYDVNLKIDGGAADLSLLGQYTASESNPNLDINLDIRKIDMAFIQAFADSLLDESKGSIRGSFTAKGDPKAPTYNGNLNFNKTSFKVKPINSGFAISDDPIKIDNGGIYFKKFALKDENGNSSTLTGTIGTKDMMNPTFDLSLISKDFQLINSTREDNDLYYGKVLMNINMKVTGDLKEPHVDVKTRLNKGTAVTLIVPESKVEVVDREGVVIFTNVKNPDDPLTNEVNDPNQSTFTGMQVRALIEVDPETTFKIVLDERSGDFLEVKGEANLTFDIDPNGRMSMSGGYALKGGQYEVSLYGVVKRKFDITPGGTITWFGNAPTNAEMNLSASYFVKASAYDLMAQQLTGMDGATRNRYRQVLPFNVFINIKGQLLHPKIFFAIDMPEKDRGALGGTVYSRVQQLNQDENELNTQVFALLVLDRFIATAGGGGAGGTSSGTLARSSVSQVLSGQLNSLSQKYVKFVDLNVDLNSYTDYQTGVGQDRTDLNVNVQKKLFNDRVVVKVGSQMALEGGQQQQSQNPNSNSVMGDASVEYLLTSDGRYMLTGFRKSEYASVVDGQLIITGVSIVLNKEFNHFKEIWRATPDPAPVKEEEKPEEAEDIKQEEKTDKKEESEKK